MLRVLIVDEDPSVVALYRRYVSRIEGFTVQSVAYTSEDALRILESLSVDLLILDQFLHNMTGMELLTYIRRSGIEVDAMMISTVSEGRNVQMALRYGAVDYLVKPFDFERFRNALTSYRQRVECISAVAPLRQEDIDGRILTVGRRAAPKELPKGLERETLDRIRAEARRIGDAFSTQDMASLVGISRVTARKYLEFLKESEELESSLSYRSAGRPLSLYQYVER